MRQAYDYWQDQPGSCIRGGRAGPRAERTRPRPPRRGVFAVLVPLPSGEGSVSSVAHLTDSPDRAAIRKGRSRRTSHRLPAALPITPSDPPRARALMQAVTRLIRLRPLTHACIGTSFSSTPSPRAGAPPSPGERACADPQREAAPGAGRTNLSFVYCFFFSISGASPRFLLMRHDTEKHKGRSATFRPEPPGCSSPLPHVARPTTKTP